MDGIYTRMRYVAFIILLAVAGMSWGDEYFTLSCYQTSSVLFGRTVQKAGPSTDPWASTVKVTDNKLIRHLPRINMTYEYSITERRTNEPALDGVSHTYVGGYRRSEGSFGTSLLALRLNEDGTWRFQHSSVSMAGVNGNLGNCKVM